MCGPSATTKPISPNIATISSTVWLIGWSRPAVAKGTGKVGSARSAARRCSSAARPSRAAASPSAAVMQSLAAFNSAPARRRSSGSSPPNSRIARVNEPRRPSTLTRISSSASGDGAAAISATIASVEGSKSAIGSFSQTKGPDGPLAYSTPTPGLNRLIPDAGWAGARLPRPGTLSRGPRGAARERYRGGGTGRVILQDLGHFRFYAFNASPTRPRVRRGDLILSRGAIIALWVARPQQPGRTG